MLAEMRCKKARVAARHPPTRWCETSWSNSSRPFTTSFVKTKYFSVVSFRHVVSDCFLFLFASWTVRRQEDCFTILERVRRMVGME